MLLGSLLLVGLLAIGARHFRYYLIWDNFGEVAEGRIYRSARLKPFQMESVARRYALKTVVNLDYDLEKDAEIQRRLAALGVRYVAANWPGDGIVTEAEVERIYAIIIDPANQPVLFHCARGTSRSGILGAYYRIEHDGWNPQQVREEMVHYRHRPSSNRELTGLVDQLAQTHGSRSFGATK